MSTPPLTQLSQESTQVAVADPQPTGEEVSGATEVAEDPEVLPALIPAERVVEEHVPKAEPAPLDADIKLLALRASDFDKCRWVKLDNGAIYFALKDAVRRVTGQTVNQELSQADLSHVAHRCALNHSLYVQTNHEHNSRRACMPRFQFQGKSVPTPVVTFQEFLHVICDLKGEDAKKIRHQSMKIASLAIAGDPSLADQIMEREALGAEEQAFFGGGSVSSDKSSPGVLGKRRARTSEEIELNRMAAVHRREKRRRERAMFKNWNKALEALLLRVEALEDHSST
jgi:hypothetical protein